MDEDIPAYFEDIDPFYEITFERLTKLTNEEKQKYALQLEAFLVPEPEKFTFLQYALSFFALGLDEAKKVKSAVLIIDDAQDGEKVYKDLITYNGAPDLEFNIEGDAETMDDSFIEGLQLKVYTWHMGRSAMSFSLFPSKEVGSIKILSRIHLKIR